MINLFAEQVPLEHGLIVAAILFVLGFAGVMVRRNILFVLISIEIMMNAAAMAFVVAGSRWLQPDGQIMFIMILTLAAAEASMRSWRVSGLMAVNASAMVTARPSHAGASATRLLVAR